MMIVDDSIRILAIEDNPSDVKLMRILLQRGLGKQFHFESRASLKSGLDRLQEGGIDVILLDLTLPETSGIDSFLGLREQIANIPVVILTGMSDREIAIEAVRNGAQDYLVKDRIDEDSIARSIRFSIERNKRVQAEQELYAATKVQDALYPDTGPQLDGFDIAGVVNPAGAGCGDYFDYIPFPSGLIAMVVGDVSGHGMGSALRMVETRAYLRSLVTTKSDPGEILIQVNQLLSADRVSQFVTLFLAVLDPATKTLTYSSAGHLAYILRGSDQIEQGQFGGTRRSQAKATQFDSFERSSFQQGPWEFLKSTNIPLAVKPNEIFSTVSSIQLLPGDLVLLPTDGIEESRPGNSNLFGKKRMLDAVKENRDRPAKEIVNNLCQVARAHAASHAPEDDMAVIVIKVDGEKN